MDTPALKVTVETWAENLVDLMFDTATVIGMVGNRIVETKLVAIRMVAADLGWVHCRLEKHFRDFAVKRYFGRLMDSISVTLLVVDDTPLDMIDRMDSVWADLAGRIADNC